MDRDAAAMGDCPASGQTLREDYYPGVQMGNASTEMQSSAQRLVEAELESLGALASALTTKPSLPVLHVISNGFQIIPLPPHDLSGAAFLHLLSDVVPKPCRSLQPRRQHG